MLSFCALEESSFKTKQASRGEKGRRQEVEHLCATLQNVAISAYRNSRGIKSGTLDVGLEAALVTLTLSQQTTEVPAQHTMCFACTGYFLGAIEGEIGKNRVFKGNCASLC